MYNFYIYGKKGEMITWGKIPAFGIMDVMKKAVMKLQSDGYDVDRILLAQDAGGTRPPVVSNYKWKNGRMVEVK